MPYSTIEKRRAHATAFRRDHPDRVKAYNATYYAKHREKKRAASAAYDVKHKEKRRAAAAAYAQTNPKRREIWCATQARRRSRVRAQFVAPIDRPAIYKRDNGCCHICGKHVKQTEMSIDHLIPISHGGPHAPWNVGLAHTPCNITRGNRGVAQLRLPFI